MAACLRSRFLAMSWSSAPSSASTSLNAPAMARCSGFGAHLGLLVAGLHFHTAPIFLRCSSTRAASVATSPVSCGSGVA
jgi:hypothetical protein